MNTNLRILVALASIPALAWVCRTEPAPQALAWPPPVEEFNSISTLDMIERIGRYYVIGNVVLYPRERQVAISFSAHLSGPRETPLAIGTLRESVTFCPTAAAVVDSSHVVVAGHDPSGATLNTYFEIWTIGPASVSAVLLPDGTRNHVMTTPVVTDRTPLFQIDAAGKRGVRRLVKLRGKPASLLVQFHDSRDLYELNYASHQPTLLQLYASQAGGAAPVLPDLALDDLRETFGAEHQSRGFLYVFDASNQSRYEHPPGSPAVALVDANYDGVLDSVLRPTDDERAQWKEEGFKEWGLVTRW